MRKLEVFILIAVLFLSSCAFLEGYLQQEPGKKRTDGERVQYDAGKVIKTIVEAVAPDWAAAGVRGLLLLVLGLIYRKKKQEQKQKDCMILAVENFKRAAKDPEVVKQLTDFIEAKAKEGKMGALLYTAYKQVTKNN